MGLLKFPRMGGVFMFVPWNGNPGRPFIPGTFGFRPVFRAGLRTRELNR